MHFRFCVTALLFALAGSIATAQKIATVDDLDKAMKKVQQANTAANKAIRSNDFGEAAKQLAIVRQTIDESREFWVLNKKDDAIAANKETVSKLEAVEKMLAGGSPDGQAVVAAIKQEVGPACRQCHEKYRVRDADNNWVLKPGSVETK